MRPALLWRCTLSAAGDVSCWCRCLCSDAMSCWCPASMRSCRLLLHERGGGTQLATQCSSRPATAAEGGHDCRLQLQGVASACSRIASRACDKGSQCCPGCHATASMLHIWWQLTVACQCECGCECGCECVIYLLTSTYPADAALAVSTARVILRRRGCTRVVTGLLPSATTDTSHAQS